MDFGSARISSLAASEWVSECVIFFSYFPTALFSRKGRRSASSSARKIRIARCRMISARLCGHKDTVREHPAANAIAAPRGTGEPFGMTDSQSWYTHTHVHSRNNNQTVSTFCASCSVFTSRQPRRLADANDVAGAVCRRESSTAWKLANKKRHILFPQTKKKYC